MSESPHEHTSGPRSSGLGWFWLGTGIGFLTSAVAVIAGAELLRILRRHHIEASFEQGEVDLVHDLADAVHGGIFTLDAAAEQIGQTFREARAEIVRYGLDPSAASPSSRYIWYTGEEEE
jgi:hypothetical protein